MSRVSALPLRAAISIVSRQLGVQRQYGTTSVLLTQASKTLHSEMSLKNRFLQASVATLKLKDYMSPEEYIESYGYHQRVSKGKNQTEKPSEEANVDILQKWESWTKCNEMPVEEAQEKFVKMITAVRIRAGFGAFSA